MIFESARSPTTQTSSPDVSCRVSKEAVRTGVLPIAVGSYDTIARLCSG
jgi:hypothetical protein